MNEATPELDARLAMFLADVELSARAQPRVGDAQALAETMELALYDGVETKRRSLGELWREVQHLEPERRGRRIEEVCRDLARRRAAPRSWSEAKRKLLPALMPVTSFGLDADGRTVRPKLATEVVPMLFEMPVVEVGGAFVYLTNEPFKRWARSVDEVLGASLSNLAEHVAQDEVRLYEGEEDGTPLPIFELVSADGLASSRILLPDFLRQVGEQVDGQAVAIVPDRNRLLMCGDADPEAVALLAAMGRVLYLEAVFPLSPCVYTLEGERLVMLQGEDAEDPVTQELDACFNLLAAREYARQGRQLEAREDQPDGGGAQVVGLHMVGEDHDDEDEDEDEEADDEDDGEEDSPSISYAPWSQGVDVVLLPQAELLLLNGWDDAGDGDVQPWNAVVPFEVAVEVLASEGCLERVDGLTPPRFRTVTWPAKSVVERLRRRAEEVQTAAQARAQAASGDDDVDYSALFEIDPTARFIGVYVPGGPPDLLFAASSEPLDLHDRMEEELLGLLFPVDESTMVEDLLEPTQFGEASQASAR